MRCVCEAYLKQWKDMVGRTAAGLLASHAALASDVQQQQQQQVRVRRPHQGMGCSMRRFSGVPSSAVFGRHVRV